MKTKGIILAGGHGTRLSPLTIISSKQLLPVYDKPMIYYPLSTLMLAGIKDIIIITKKMDQNTFKKLLGNGNQWGIKLTYLIQKKPSGLPEAFKISSKYIKNSFITMILGDNIFYGSNFNYQLRQVVKNNISSIFTYKVNDPSRYGVVNFTKNGFRLEEKPKKPKSNFAVTGIYCFSSKVLDRHKKLKKSKRNETEIIDLIKLYKNKYGINIVTLGRGDSWLDTGTFDSLHDASQFIQILEKRQGLKIAIPDEIAYRMKFINKKQLNYNIKNYSKTNINFYNYLKQLKYE